MISVELDAGNTRGFIQNFNKALMGRLGDAVERIGRKVERDAKQYAPKITGNLARQIDFKRTGATGEVRAKANYSAFVHGEPYHVASGARRTTPFFTLAKDNNQKFAQDELANAINDSIKVSQN